MTILSPEAFVRIWQQVELNERAVAQSHFLDVCRLVGHATPAEIDPTGASFTFEKGVATTGGGHGWADVWYDKHFAIEYKTKGKYRTLDEAYQQLLRYRENLNNPPLLVVCDIEHWEIHTNWPGMEKKVYKFTNSELLKPSVLEWVRDLFFQPGKLNPERNKEAVTVAAATLFKDVADSIDDWAYHPDEVAQFLTRLIFCLFAEDIGLLPLGYSGYRGIFQEILHNSYTEPRVFAKYVQQLFEAMADGGEVLMRKIRYFNGALFEDVGVKDIGRKGLDILYKAADFRWEQIEPTIFGTLFERVLDPTKRRQIGAHYTSPSDILLIVEPVLMQPLKRTWQSIQQEAAPLREQYEAAKTTRERQALAEPLVVLRDRMLAEVRGVRVLDPACGSGNFLYVSLGLLMDLEKEVVNHALFGGVPRPATVQGVHPRQLYGIEINPIAHALASIVVWIGYMQWRKANNLLDYPEPVLEKLDNIKLMDAILAFDGDGKPVEPEWPAVDVIVGNPPFLGDKKMRSELGDIYVDKLRAHYVGRVAGGADLVTYWYEKARTLLEQGDAKRVGLLSTNSIRMGANRRVLERIKATGDIFMAWSDRDWVLDGASVRVSMVGFDNGREKDRSLDGKSVAIINANLTTNTDVTQAKHLVENENICFLGVMKSGPFDIDSATADTMLKAPINAEGRPNSDVVKPRLNGQDIAGRSREGWIIDFGSDTSEIEASLYRMPYEYVKTKVKPIREKNTVASLRTKWWLHARPRQAMSHAIEALQRFIVTPEVAKHRLFVWVEKGTIPDHKLHVFARDDDYFFGVLHSLLHEIWTLATCSWIGKGNDPSYASSKTFETFPFPWSPGSEPLKTDTMYGVPTNEAGARYEAIAAAAKQLHEERHAWLNPVGVREKELKERTLTNLYNALNVWRGVEKIKVVAAAGDFAPRLDELHRALDGAVCAAYGWEVEILQDEEEMLRRLLALNLERAGGKA